MTQDSNEVVTQLLKQRQALVTFGRMALQSDDLSVVLEEACRLTSAALGTDLAKVMELQDKGRSLCVVAGVGWKDGVVGVEKVPTIGRSSEGYALRTGVPAISPDVDEEERFDYADFLKRHGVQAIVNVVIPGAEGRPPYGLLQVDSCEPREFTTNEIEFLQGYANIIGAAIERHYYQAELDEALRIKARLLTELQHRVNNNLSIMSSMLKIKSKRTAHPVVKQEIAVILSQIDVLKQIHEKLHTSERMLEVELGSYLSSLCNNLVGFNELKPQDIRIKTMTDTVFVQPSMAVPLGIVTNEFVTNSIKHGSKNGDLIISLSVDVDDTALKLVLSDNGPGFGNAIEKKDAENSGSGLGLIEGMLAQLHSDWEWSGDDGTSLTIRIQLSQNSVRPLG